MRAFLLLFQAAACVALGTPRWFEIAVIDRQTGRGVPGAELETVNHVRHLTDSAGRIAYAEPGHEKRTVFFYTRAPGYEFAKDGFGMTGARLTIEAGGKAAILAKRLNLAERLYRTTGEGIYRDSVLLGYAPPAAQPLLNADVAGQDSIQRVIYQGRIHWFWGDTTRLSYPLGNFRMSGAVSDLPSKGGLKPALGIDYRYFTNRDGGPKGMFPLEPKGDLIWADGFLTVTHQGTERMLAHYQRLKSLTEPLGQGLAVFNDDRSEFGLLHSLGLEEKWRFPHGHPLRHGGFFHFGIGFPNVRTKTDWDSVTNASSYEAWSCLEGDRVVPYRWTRDAAPAGPKEEKDLLDKGLITRNQAHFLPRDVETDKVVTIHSGSVAWNAWRKRWILVGVQLGGTSMLGEVWYSEADQPTGPWRHARKIVTHDNYSFYNPAHHPFFDEEGGRVIYFEGTYTREFSGGTSFTPRYDYNQVIYRLDLANAALPASK